MDALEKLAAIKVEKEEKADLAYRQGAAIREARAETPPVPWKIIAATVGLTEFGALKASKVGAPDGE